MLNYLMIFPHARYLVPVVIYARPASKMLNCSCNSSQLLWKLLNDFYIIGKSIDKMILIKNIWEDAAYQTSMNYKTSDKQQKMN